MKFVSRFFVSGAIIFYSYSLSAQSDIDVLNYTFEIGLNDRSDSIKGKVAIQLKLLNQTNTIRLDLTSVKQNGKGMWVHKVLENNNPVGFKQSADSLILKFAEGKAGMVKTFIIEYSGIPADGLIISKNKYGERTYFADNWPNRAHNWIPCKDEPGDKATFEFIVTAPAQYQVISNGILAEEKILSGNNKLTHWKEGVPLSTKVMVIGVARFAIKQFTDSPPGIPVSAWVYPQDSVKGFENYSVAPAILKFYSDYIGPYPYNKLANVQSKTIFGGMENASAIFYYEESAASKNSVEDLLAHEIAHQWFGDMATEKSFPHLWLSEGFATYMTDLYIESKYGTDSMNRRLKSERRTVVNFSKRSDQPIVDSISSYMDLLNANSYQKGAWVLHMLRRQIGDSAFHLFIKKYYDRYKGKNADTNDLVAVAGEVVNKDLKSFFRQWLFTPGIPQLNVKWKYDEKEKKVLVTIDQIQKQGAFQFPFQLQLQTASGKSSTETLNITKQTETFNIPVKESIVNIYADPNTSLLFDGKIEKN